ncbi:mannose/cellobiose epimerase-like protein (N-acyl-D-glucosamine 2-epimerase family) [Variovorax sp. TBS-050B]|nr:mannose/cellobiose epimerase-like protein (N-acyl-D-glucosamine 2-epimerase family) [Variovorax sp. TBS-050B]
MRFAATLPRLCRHPIIQRMPPMPDFRSPDFLTGHIRHTLDFYEPVSRDSSGGFFHFFKDDGTVYDRRTRHLVSSTRFVFNHAMAARRFGDAKHLDHARHALAFVRQAHAQSAGGYAWQIDWHDGRAQVQDGTQHCYGLAFVLLAHAHALMAGVDEARAGLDDTWQLMERRFWEPQHALYADEASPDWRVAPYRGQNANMHACEAMLAAFEATRETRFIERALALAESITGRQAALADGLVWEHYREDWSIDWDYNRGDKSNIFRPWGFQTGHLTEWAKLLLQLERALVDAGREAPGWIVPRAKHFFDTAMARGWDAAHGGLVYGFGPDGAVCDGDKYFWVQAESFAAAALLAVRTGDAAYWHWYDRIWTYSWAHFVDHRHGAWYRILTPDNRKISDEKSPAGKTDYHTMGACHDVLRALGA